MTGGLLALLSAATFALNQALARRGVLTGSVIQALCITVPLGVPMFLLIALAIGHIGDLVTFSATSVFWLSLAGVNHFIAGRFFNYLGVKAAGTNITGTVQQLDIVVSLALAVWLLGEFLTPLRLAGIALIMFAPLLTLRRDIAAAKGHGAGQAAAKFTPDLVRGYVCAALAGLAYGVSPILVRAGLQDASPGASMAGGAISYAAASICLLAIVLATGQARHVAAIDPRNAAFFASAGLSVGAAQVFRYAALAMAPVAVVAPILRLSLIFRIIFSWWLNREHEVFSKGIVLATMLSLLGAFMVSLSSEFIQSVMDVPIWARWMIDLKWP